MKALICYSWICSTVLCLSVNATPTVTSNSTNLSITEVKLAGIVGIFGDKRAMLVIQEATDPGETARRPYSCTLKEGQSSGPIQILQVDQENGSVRIRNGDVEQEITFSRDGVEMPAATTTGTTPVASVSAAPLASFTFISQPATYQSPVRRHVPTVYQYVRPQSQVYVIRQYTPRLGSGYSSYSSFHSRGNFSYYSGPSRYYHGSSHYRPTWSGSHYRDADCSVSSGRYYRGGDRGRRHWR